VSRSFQTVSEPPFSEIRLPEMPILGNSSIKRAGVIGITV